MPAAPRIKPNRCHLRRESRLPRARLLLRRAHIRRRAAVSPGKKAVAVSRSRSGGWRLSPTSLACGGGGWWRRRPGKEAGCHRPGAGARRREGPPPPEVNARAGREPAVGAPPRSCSLAGVPLCRGRPPPWRGWRRRPAGEEKASDGGGEGVRRRSAGEEKAAAGLPRRRGCAGGGGRPEEGGGGAPRRMEADARWMEADGWNGERRENSEYEERDESDCKMQNVMQRRLEAAQCRFLLYFADALADRDSAGVGLSVRHGQGYLCNCSQGYAGNPYVTDGCKNIDECQLQSYSCPTGSSCVDTEGLYRCQCKFGRKGDDCRPIFPASAAAVLATFVASLFLSLLLWSVHKDRKRRIKTAFFDKNGGKILKGAADINIFTEVQIDKFTNHYDTLIGKGAFGKVFMGTTDDNQRVAVKRSIIEEKELRGIENHEQGEDIVNEITFQFRNSHPNLVQLVGCCLETNIPVLVFEFISNGNLYNLLHVARHKVVPLPTRLKIAIGSSEALAYIHSHGDQDRVHGDVKSANILLDVNLMPKVSDFGSSKLLSIDRYAMVVAADMSYVDTVYMKTERFEKKSDVYSFGMVLLELITRKTVKYGGNRINSLPMDFVRCCKEKGNGREMYDIVISSHGDSLCHHCIDCLDKVGDLAVRCLKEDVDERPTMAEVVDELKLAAEAVEKCKQHANLIPTDRSFCLEVC